MSALRSGSTDYLIIGGGVVGLSIALELRRRWPSASLVLLEKEMRCGLHASGRNSGVLHAGFYYTADSLKARFSRDGNRELTEYCLSKSIRLNRCGKLVVATSEAELAVLDELFQRAEANGVMVERINSDDARRLEPRVRTVGAALYSPTTSSVDPSEVVDALVGDARAQEVEVLTGKAYRGHSGHRVSTSTGWLTAGYVVNAAGLYADKIAHDYSLGQEYKILPFRGQYLDYQDDGPVPRMHVYPVPRLDYPFLGVHWTTTAAGGTRIGPTAAPALWREHYEGTTGFNLTESVDIGYTAASLWFRDEGKFRKVALRELQKRTKRRLRSLAMQLVRPGTGPGRWRWGRPGVRAQLLNTDRRSLEMDFRCIGDDKSFHVLNAVSPAFTCAFPFARFVADRIESAREVSNG